MPHSIRVSNMQYYAAFGGDGPNVCDNISGLMKRRALRALLSLLAHHDRGVSAVMRSGGRSVSVSIS